MPLEQQDLLQDFAVIKIKRETADLGGDGNQIVLPHTRWQCGDVTKYVCVSKSSAALCDPFHVPGYSMSSFQHHLSI